MHATNDSGVARIAQLFAGAPEHAAARGPNNISGRIVAVADGDAAIAIAEVRRQSDRIFPRHRKPEIAAGRIVRGFRPEPQHAVPGRLGKRLVVIGSGRHAALGEEHVAVIVEKNLGNFRAGQIAARNVELDARVASERAIGQDSDRPNAQSRRNRVIKAATIDRHAENTAHNRRIGPCRGIAAVERRAFNIQARPRIVGDRRKLHGCEPLHTVIEPPALHPVEREAVNHAGAAIGGKELA